VVVDESRRRLRRFTRWIHGRVQLFFRILLTLSAVICVGSHAFAHHGSSTTRVGGLGGVQRLDSQLGGMAPPRVDAGLTHDFLYFGRVLEASEETERADLGQVYLTTLSASFRFVLETGTAGSLRLPVGFVFVNPSNADEELRAGLGDLQLTVTQNIAELWDPKEVGPLSLFMTAGLIAPTGRYETESSLSFTDVSGTPQGAIELVTFNTRATLGAGAWSTLGALRIAFAASNRLSLEVRGQIVDPFTRTPDEIAWGIDAEAALRLGFEISPGRLRVVGGADYRHHGQDEIDALNEETGGISRDRVGGRDEFGVSTGLEFRVLPRLGCSVQAHIPVWKRVGGVQLVETLGVSTGCDYAFDL